MEVRPCYQGNSRDQFVSYIVSQFVTIYRTIGQLISKLLFIVVQETPQIKGMKLTLVQSKCVIQWHSMMWGRTEETFLRHNAFLNRWPKCRSTTVTLEILLRNNAFCESDHCVLSCLVCWKRGKKSAAQLCHTMVVPSTITGHPNKKPSETQGVSACVFRLLDVFKQYRALVVTRDRKQQIRSKVARSH